MVEKAITEAQVNADGTRINAFDPWARDRGECYSLKWVPRPGAEAGPAFRESK